MALPTPEQIFSVLGAISAICTALSLFFPKGSAGGAFLARIGADLKGHNIRVKGADESGGPQ